MDTSSGYMLLPVSLEVINANIDEWSGPVRVKFVRNDDDTIEMWIMEVTNDLSSD